MRAHQRKQGWSLGHKLVLAGLCVQLLVSGLIMGIEFRAIEDLVGKELSERVQRSAPLLKSALTEPLLQRDYATLNQILAEVQDTVGYTYFVLIDPQGRNIAAAGLVPPLPWPQVDEDFSSLPWDRDDHCVHLAVPIQFGSKNLATLRYGTSLESSRAQRNALMTNSLLAAALGLVLGTIAFALLGLGLTRGLQRLTRHTESVAEGRYELVPEVQGSDELAHLAKSFNRMSAAVKDRVRALQTSEAKQQQYLVQAQEDRARLLALLHAMRFGVLLLGRNRQVIYANQAFATLWHMDYAALEAEFGEEVQTPGRSVFWRSANGELMQLLRLERPAHPAAVVQDVRLESGQEIQVSSESVLDIGGETIGHLWLFEDLTRERHAQSLISQLAQRDSLTSLLNRHTFQQQLQAHATDESQRLALFYIDLDGFKMINDLNGHSLGDRLLQGVANALTVTFRSQDVIARLGGDEFAVAVPGIEAKELEAICERLLRNVSKASGSVMAYSAVPVKISCSVGVAWFPEDGHDADSLVAAADTAMYSAKAAGRNTWRTFQAGQGSNSEKALWLVWSDRLNEAFEYNRFKVFLQGIYSTETGVLDHYEALVRLEDLDRPGNYYPILEFISHAEDSGKIQQLDRFMLMQCVSHLREHPDHEPIAVNLSSRTLVDATLVGYVEQAIRASGISPMRLHFELTETAALTHIEQAIKTVKGLQKLGCEVGLDDFGSGFTSFTYLRDLGVDYIKIDGSFIRSLWHDNESKIFLKAVVDIAHQSNRRVVAEWIEDKETLALVQTFNVDLVQGFLLDQPHEIGRRRAL